MHARCRGTRREIPGLHSHTDKDQNPLGRIMAPTWRIHEWQIPQILTTLYLASLLSYNAFAPLGTWEAGPWARRPATTPLLRPLQSIESPDAHIVLCMDDGLPQLSTHGLTYSKRTSPCGWATNRPITPLVLILLASFKRLQHTSNVI